MPAIADRCHTADEYVVRSSLVMIERLQCFCIALRLSEKQEDMEEERTFPAKTSGDIPLVSMSFWKTLPIYPSLVHSSS